MTTALASFLVRGDRRVRLFFTGALAGGAFTSTAPYAVTSHDGLGGVPTVVAVFAVASDPNAIELAVDQDFVGGATYAFMCTAVPCADASSFTGSLQGGSPAPLTADPNTEPVVNDLDLTLYSRDLLHDGLDFVETPSGDLASLTGRGNWLGAVSRRVASVGLGWDPSYAPELDQYVDGGEPLAPILASSIATAARADNRTAKAACSAQQDPISPGDWYYALVLASRDGLDPVVLHLAQPKT